MRSAGTPLVTRAHPATTTRVWFAGISANVRETGPPVFSTAPRTIATCRGH